ncbi:hypothetical protein C8R45DRAFT_953143 [Mycena sanguinolenta]|nr:hypothetical protein C8R45DRAFT_953143 [Mycena sanguinolenta]
MFISSFPLPEHGDIYKAEQLDLDDTASSGDGSSTDDSEAVNQTIRPIDSPPGVHRFIGVISVGVLIVLLSLWLVRRNILLGRSNSAAMQDGNRNLGDENTQRNPARNINTSRRIRSVATGPLGPPAANSNVQPQRQPDGGDAAAIRQGPSSR